MEICDIRLNSFENHSSSTLEFLDAYRLYFDCIKDCNFPNARKIHLKNNGIKRVINLNAESAEVINFINNPGLNIIENLNAPNADIIFSDEHDKIITNSVFKKIRNHEKIYDNNNVMIFKFKPEIDLYHELYEDIEYDEKIKVICIHNCKENQLIKLKCCNEILHKTCFIHDFVVMCKKKCLHCYTKFSLSTPE